MARIYGKLSKSVVHGCTGPKTLSKKFMNQPGLIGDQWQPSRSNTTYTAENLPLELEKLKPLDLIHLNQVRIRYKNEGLQGGYGIDGSYVIELDILNRDQEVLLKMEFLRGQLPQEYFINLYGLGEEKPLLAEMELERCLQHRAFILRVRSPPGSLIGSVYELPGISQVAIVENSKSESILQVITNGGFGWATAALILNGTGEKKLGRMDKSKLVMKQKALFTAITFPTSLATTSKITLLGICLTFVRIL